MVKNLNYAQFKKNILGKRQTCVVKFYSDSCPLCVNLAPLYETLSKRYAGRAIFYKVDTFKEKKLTEFFSDDGVPTIYFFHNGNYGEIPFPYDDPDGWTGYRESDITDYIEKRIDDV